MQINNLNYLTYNVNHKGFIKDYKALKRQVYVLQTKSEFCNNQQIMELLKKADINFVSFCRKNPLKTCLYNIIKNFKFISQNRILPIKNDIRQEIYFKEKEIIQKRQDMKFLVDGKEYSNIEFNNLYKKEINPSKKEEMHAQFSVKLNSFENDLRELVIKRNEYAQNLGYKNYFDYFLTLQYDISPKELEKMINYYVNNEEVKAAVLKRRKILEKEHKIEFSKMTASQIEPITNFCNIDKYIKTTSRLIDIVKNAYQNMGFDIKSLEKNERIIYDLEQYNGKSSRVFCRNLPEVDSAMIYATLQPETHHLEAFLHEMGHAMYDLHVSKFLPNSLKIPKAFYNEAIAMLFEKILTEKSFLADFVPPKAAKKLREYSKVEKIYEGLVMLAEAEFEKEIYNNPNQDFIALRKKINKKYNLSPKNEIWFVDHYVTNPARRPVYLKGFILADKIYKTLRRYLGTDLNSNPKVAEILIKKIFKYGHFMNDKILNKNLKI